MAANNILPFGATASNELTQAAYLAEAQRLTGNQPGKASSKLVNKVLHQTNLIASGLAQFLADRQGSDVVDTLTPAQIATMLATVLNGPNLLATPAQFDSDASPATTAFVQRALGNYQAMNAVNAPATLTAADSGKMISLGGTAIATLPIGSTVVSGTIFNFVSVIAGRTVLAQGSDQIFTSSSTVGGLTLNVGDTAFLTWNGTQWVLVGGTVQLQYSNSFGSLKTGNGWQRLPGGLLLQWGFGSTVAANGATGTVISFPLAFPSTALSLLCTDSGATTFVIGGQPVNPTTFKAWARDTSAGAYGNAAFYYFAIGY
jgi:hypothetical protein